MERRGSSVDKFSENPILATGEQSEVIPLLIFLPLKQSKSKVAVTKHLTMNSQYAILAILFGCDIIAGIVNLRFPSNFVSAVNAAGF
jgi:hypothetical protein